MKRTEQVIVEMTAAELLERLGLPVAAQVLVRGERLMGPVAVDLFEFYFTRAQETGTKS